ncbi:DUF1566 domain-containing protein [Desulfogranum marinum]|uniref:Lcl C-terminal domain-containing protein n=1 Tax=Desulfogranum marinum TaxID=453220 RepID=UPI0029C82833|nr:DUF1566 domain-containing protein [Desulfogranum marinum]
MNMFARLHLSDFTGAAIEWDMTPDLAFCTFSAKGLSEGLTSTKERVCYFFVDNWGTSPRLYLMERGVRHVHILAEVKAPQQLIEDCIISHGGTLNSRDNFPVNAALKKWLLAEVVEPEHSPFLFPVTDETAVEEERGEALPILGKTGFTGTTVMLPVEQTTLDDEQIKQIIMQWNFFDAQLNPHGSFANFLADDDDKTVVVDEKTGLMWQCGGVDLCSIRNMKRAIEQLNNNGFAGYHDWRMPTVEEAMSLMETAPNAKGIYLHPCFSREQPFIFVAARRRPTGYWFVDYMQGKMYWSSGTVPGGFCRLCRGAN